MESTISVASSGPRIASMMDGSRVVEGRIGGSVEGECVGAVDWDVAQFSSSFARLSIVDERKLREGNFRNDRR